MRKLILLILLIINSLGVFSTDYKLCLTSDPFDVKAKKLSLRDGDLDYVFEDKSDNFNIAVVSPVYISSTYEYRNWKGEVYPVCTENASPDMGYRRVPGVGHDPLDPMLTPIDENMSSFFSAFLFLVVYSLTKHRKLST